MGDPMVFGNRPDGRVHSFAWDTTGVANGTRTIRVVATDTDGTPKSGYFERTVTVSNTVGVSVSPAAATLNATTKRRGRSGTCSIPRPCY
jgi:hypothetical protein